MSKIETLGTKISIKFFVFSIFWTGSQLGFPTFELFGLDPNWDFRLLDFLDWIPIGISDFLTFLTGSRLGFLTF
jgi:hypothetical protein